MTQFITRPQAVSQAAALRLYDRLPAPPLARVLYRSIANPQASSDTLLILAEALRDGADKALMALANEIAALAPTRATPLPPPPTTVHATMAATLAEVHHHMARTEVAGIVPGHNPQ